MDSIAVFSLDQRLGIMKFFFYLSISVAAVLSPAKCGSLDAILYTYPGVDICTGDESAAGPITVGLVTLSGGRIRRNLLYPGGVYASDSACGGDKEQVTLTFKYGVQDIEIYFFDRHTIGPSPYTYLFQDNRGDTVLPSYIGYYASGGIELPSAKITKVTMAPGPFTMPCANCNPATGKPTWKYMISDIRFTSTFTMVDPIPALVNAGTPNGLAVTYSDPLAGKQSSVIAADGAAQLVVGVQAHFPGERFNATILSDGRPSISVNMDGSFSDIESKPGLSAGVATVRAVSTAAGPIAFFVYHAPDNYSRAGSSDSSSFSRELAASVDSPDTPGYGANFSWSLVRPPVVFIHGLWGSHSDWDSFLPLLSDPYLTTYTADYSAIAPGSFALEDREPYNPVPHPVKRNELGLAYNAPDILDTIAFDIDQFRTLYTAAAVRADVVAHSMGGLITRKLTTLPNYLAPNNFGAGTVHKLITIGTPHLGTPLAIDLLPSGPRTDPNGCIRRVLAASGLASYSEVVRSAGKTISGAIGDLKGDGFGSALSSAIAELHSSKKQTLRMTMVAGLADQSNLRGLDCTSCKASAIRNFCKGEPLVTSLTAPRWQEIFLQGNDAIVPILSQLNNGSGVRITGVVHSSGVNSGLSFAGLNELNSAAMAAEIRRLLYTSATVFPFTQQP